MRFCWVFLFFHSGFFAQSLSKITGLSPELEEISGLCFLNDSVLIAHNDSGAEAILYFLNLKGEIFHRLKISNATNEDWEDITIDKGTIYIGDIGNNRNRRNDLKIYMLPSDSVLIKHKAEARIISFGYDEQALFPPDEKEMDFDAEALGFYRDSLVILTKCHSKPFSGKSYCYKIPAKEGSYTVKRFQELPLKESDGRYDVVTAVEFYEDSCFVLTYTGIEIFSLQANAFQFEKRISFLKLSQKEALCVNRSYFYIADEHHKILGGGNLYQLKRK